MRIDQGRTHEPNYTSPLLWEGVFRVSERSVWACCQLIFYSKNQMGYEDPKGACPPRQAKNGAVRKTGESPRPPNSL